MAADLYEPQAILDHLHRANVPGLFEVGISEREQRTRLEHAKKTLDEADKFIQRSISSLKTQYTPDKKKRGSSDEQALKEKLRKSLAPYLLLETLLKEIRGQVQKLEDAIAAGKLIPPGFEFDEYIFGDSETGEWFLGDHEAYDLWQYALDVKQRLNGFMEQREPLHQQMKTLKQAIDATKREAQEAKRSLRKQQETKGRFRMVFALLTLGGLGGIGFAIFQAITVQPLNLPIIAGAGGVGGLLLFIAFISGRVRRGRQQRWQEMLPIAQERYKSLQIEMKQVRAQYDPLNIKCKELLDEWRAIRKGF